MQLKFSCSRILLSPDGENGGTSAEDIQDSIQKNQVGKGEKPTKPPKSRAKTKDVVGDGKPPKKPTQQTLIEVKMDSVGKAAKRMKEAIEALESAQDEKGAASENLQKSLKKSKRTTTSYDGYQFQLKHVGPKDTITIQKPK